MKLKFKIIKNGIEAFSNVVNSNEEGDAWVAQNGPSFGLPDRSFTLEQCQAEGLDPQTAASTSEEILVLGSEPVTVYHFPKDWSVQVEDITAAEEKQSKVFDRFKARQFCLGIIDEIAVINDQLNDPQVMSAILASPNFTAIILMLLTGGVKTARALMVAHGPSLYPQDIVNDFVAKMDAFIASET